MHLSADALGMWDEGFFALRAFYLSFHGEYLNNFNQFENGWNHPNTKPPLFTLIQAGFFRLFGYNELSLRLPIASTVFLMLVFMVYFSWKQFKSLTIGIFSALVLVTSPGFMNLHIARTGDHDAVLAFWMLLIFVYFFKLVTEPQNQKKYTWLIAVFLAGSVLTKSVAGLFPLPAIFIFAIYKKKLIKLLSSWNTWGAIALFLILVSSYYLYREWKTPGFFEIVWHEDIGGRYSGENHGHNNPWYYYFDLLYNVDFIPWLFFIPFSIIILFTQSHKKYREFSLYLLFCSFSVLLIISNSDTKCEWYHAGMFPSLAFIVGIGISWLYEKLKLFIQNEETNLQTLLLVTFYLLFFLNPYIKIIDKVSFPNKEWTQEQFGEYMKKVDPDLEYTIVPGTLNLCTIFYTEVATKVEGRNIRQKATNDEFEVGEIIMCTLHNKWVEKKYTFETIHKYKNLKMIEITGKKQMASE